MRLTKVYPSGAVTVDAAQFGIDQNVIDSNIRNSEPIKAAVKRLSELEDINEPRKPLDFHEKWGYNSCGSGTCPNCYKIVNRHEFRHGKITIPRCKWCGQALDWGEAE